METSKCPKCGSTRDIHAGFEIARFYCGSAAKAGEECLYWEGEECRRRQEVNGLRAELARLKSEKEAAERERDEARKGEAKAWTDYNRKSDEQAYDFAQWFKIMNYSGLTEYQPECCIIIDGWLRELLSLRAQLTAATSRAEALEKERDTLNGFLASYGDRLHDFYGQIENDESYSREMVMFVAQVRDYLRSALLPPAKEVEGGK